MDTLGLALRVGLSLACVLGLVWLFSKGLLKTGHGRTTQRDRVQVLARQPLSRVSSVAVVQVGDRALVLGVTEQHITLLTETDVAAVAPPVEEERTPVPVGSVADVPVQRGPLSGSALSPATWAQAVEALRERTTRR